jgi:hypothetical protein
MHIRLGQAELPGDLRRLDASLEGGANSVHLSGRQMNSGRLDLRLIRGLKPHGRLSVASLLFGEYGRLQSVKLLIIKLLDRAGQVLRQNMSSCRCPVSVRWLYPVPLSTAVRNWLKTSGLKL